MPKRTFISRKLSSGSKWLFGDTVRTGKGVKPDKRLMKSVPGGARKSSYRRSRRRRYA